MDTKIIFTDIDGTLRDHRTGVPLSAHLALKKAKEQGHRLIICTGRTKCTIPEDVPIEMFDGIISGGGCRIELNGNVLFNEYLPDNIIGKYRKNFSESHIPFCFETDSGLFMSREMADIIQKMMEGADDTTDINGMKKNSVIKGNIDSFDPEIHHTSKISFNLTDEQHKAFTYCDESLKLISFIDDWNGGYFCELISSDSGKGNSLKRFCQLASCDISDTVAVGDSMNDIEMFMAAGLSVCMGNAPDEVKQHADIITDDILDDGFYGGLCRAGLIW